MGHRRKRHPVQPVEWDGQGVLRFKANPIIRYLVDNAKLPIEGHVLNVLPRVAAEHGFTRHDWDQFYQLIGYSVANCPLRSKLTMFDVDRKSEAYLARYPSDPDTKEPTE